MLEEIAEFDPLIDGVDIESEEQLSTKKKNFLKRKSLHPSSSAKSLKQFDAPSPGKYDRRKSTPMRYWPSSFYT